MENFFLIIYRQSVVLFYASVSNISFKFLNISTKEKDKTDNNNKIIFIIQIKKCLIRALHILHTFTTGDKKWL